MMRRFLKETPGASTRSLSVGRHQVHDSWDQIQAYLSSALSPAHAALFAEPFRSGGATSWMAATDAEPEAFARLDPARQAEVLARLDSLLGDVRRFAEERAASSRDEDRQWGALLEAIQQQPAGISLTDRLFVAGDQPVLTQWGCRDDATVSTGTLLRETRPAPVTAPVHAATGAGGGLAGMPPAAPPAGMAAAAGTGGWWLPALLWLLFVAAMAVIFWWLLAACALNLPPSMQIFGQCRDASAAPAEERRQAELLDRLQVLRGNLATAPQCRIEGGPQAAWSVELLPPPPPVEDAVPEPEPPHAEIPPAAPHVEAQDAEAQADTDLDRAREQAGGELGDVTITLLWNGRSDLDLLVACPSGLVVSGGRSRNTIQCGGTIDVDANYCGFPNNGRGEACRTYLNGPVDNPVENGFFNREGSQRGSYSVRIRHYAAAPDAPGTPVPYVVQLRRGEERQRFEGTAQPGTQNEITTFSFD